MVFDHLTLRRNDKRQNKLGNALFVQPETFFSDLNMLKLTTPSQPQTTAYVTFLSWHFMWKALLIHRFDTLNIPKMTHAHRQRIPSLRVGAIHFKLNIPKSKKNIAVK